MDAFLIWKKRTNVSTEHQFMAVINITQIESFSNIWYVKL